jgi:hypothetical protein
MGETLASSIAGIGPVDKCRWYGALAIGRRVVRPIGYTVLMATSTVASVRAQLIARPVGSFVWTRDVDGDSAAVCRALSRIAAEPEAPVLRVRRGLYWRTEWTRFGPRRPSVEQIAIEIAGPGAGPASMAAAHVLELTTQVLSVQYWAVPGRPPRPIKFARYFARQAHRRELGLTPLEVAVLETVNPDPAVVEAEWPSS